MRSFGAKKLAIFQKLKKGRKTEIENYNENYNEMDNEKYF